MNPIQAVMNIVAWIINLIATNIPVILIIGLIIYGSYRIWRYKEYGY
jgi:hypothetical protein